jgi:predicted transcriptional regulator
MQNLKVVESYRADYKAGKINSQGIANKADIRVQAVRHALKKLGIYRGVNK